MMTTPKVDSPSPKQKAATINHGNLYPKGFVPDPLVADCAATDNLLNNPAFFPKGIVKIKTDVILADNSTAQVQGYGPAAIKFLDVSKIPPLWSILHVGNAFFQLGSGNLISFYQLTTKHFGQDVKCLHLPTFTYDKFFF